MALLAAAVVFGAMLTLATPRPPAAPLTTLPAAPIPAPMPRTGSAM